MPLDIADMSRIFKVLKCIYYWRFFHRLVCCGGWYEIYSCFMLLSFSLSSVGQMFYCLHVPYIGQSMS